MNTSPNQAAERLPLMPESTLNNDFLTRPTLAKAESDVNEFAVKIFFEWRPRNDRYE